jgi:hypothetical protein
MCKNRKRGKIGKSSNPANAMWIRENSTKGSGGINQKITQDNFNRGRQKRKKSNLSIFCFETWSQSCYF